MNQVRCSIFLIFGSLLGACGSEPAEPESAFYCQAHFQARSFKVAAAECLDASRAGDAIAQFLIGNIKVYGLAGDADPEAGMDWLRQSAAQDYTRAQLKLGELLLSGQKAERQPEQAVDYLRKASDKGSASGQYLLGNYYYLGLGAEQDAALGLEWYLQAASRGHQLAINNSAWIMATSTDESLRDGERARDMIEGLLTDRFRPAIFLDTLAAAHAEKGEFEQAIRLQQEAIQALDDPAKAGQGGYLERLSRYREGQPWREAGPAPEITGSEPAGPSSQNDPET